MKPLRVQPQIALVTSLIGLSCAFFLFSPLGFVPVPWPDAPSFYLPWHDLFQWPSSWKASIVAAFIPSANEANFGIMPGFTVFLSSLSSLGLMSIMRPTLALKFISIMPFAVWNWFLWRWLSFKPNQGKSLPISIFILLGALWDPTNRWVALSVRPEASLALIWVLLLQQVWKTRNSRDPFHSHHLWFISFYLALAAYFHYTAMILVPGAAFALIPSELRGILFLRVWARRLFGVGMRTLCFLSPWILYCVSRFELFQEHIEFQFSKLASTPSWIIDLVGLFSEMGSATKLPTFFWTARAIFLFMSIGLVLWLATQLHQAILANLSSRSDCLLRNETSPQPIKNQFRQKTNQLLTSSTPSQFRPLQVAAVLTFCISIQLCQSAPEVWYSGLCHMFFWPAVTLLWIDRTALHSLISSGVAVLTGAFALISILATLWQSREIHPSVNWSTYNEWVDCIDQAIQIHQKTPRPKIWQTDLPDVLVDLSVRHRNYQLTRLLDYPQLVDRAVNYAREADSIILTHFRFSSPSDRVGGRFENYRGPRRPIDETVFYPATAFGTFVLEEMRTPHWTSTTCHLGSWWASVVTRKP